MEQACSSSLDESSQEDICDERIVNTQPSSSLDRRQSIGDCSVCGHIAHGIHFGVLSCRACAAFFRRTVVLKKGYKCRRAHGDCEITKAERYLCRLCRYNKCLAKGMTPDNVQILHKRHSKSVEPYREEKKERKEEKEKTPVTKDCETLQLNEEYIGPLPLNSLRFSSKPKTTVDLTGVRGKVEHTFQTFTPHFLPSFPLSSIQRMSLGLEWMRRKQNREPQMLQIIDMLHFRPKWEIQLVNIAEWMMHCEEFVTLDLSDKMSMFQMCWCAIQRFERAAMSMDMFREDILESRNFLIFDDYMISDRAPLDVTAVSNYDSQEMKRMFLPFIDRYISDVCRPILSLTLSSFEIVYILLQLLWHVDSRSYDEFAYAALIPFPADDWKPVSEACLRIAETYKERISGELHYYYIHTAKIPNYAHRLMKIWGIIHAVEQIQSERAKVFELAKVFDVFNIEYTNNGSTISPKN